MRGRSAAATSLEPWRSISHDTVTAKLEQSLRLFFPPSSHSKRKEALRIWAVWGSRAVAAGQCCSLPRGPEELLSESEKSCPPHPEHSVSQALWEGTAISPGKGPEGTGSTRSTTAQTAPLQQ